MNGPEHYREAEKLTAQAHTVDHEFAVYLVAKAQVHATLALAAAAAYPAVKDWCGDEGDDARRWSAATS